MAIKAAAPFKRAKVGVGQSRIVRVQATARLSRLVAVRTREYQDVTVVDEATAPLKSIAP